MSVLRNSTEPAFGQIANFSPWFPQLNPEDPKAKHISRRPRMLSLQLLGTIVIFLLNVSVTSWAVARCELTDGVGVIFDGNCGSVRTLSVALHLVINILGTALFGASNFCMQLLVAPTRREQDIAHTKKQWLDVGVPSLWNLTKIARGRVLIWGLLALSTGPLHLLYAIVVCPSHRPLAHVLTD